MRNNLLVLIVLIVMTLIVFGCGPSVDNVDTNLVDENITDKQQVLIEEGDSYKEVLKMAIIRIKRDNVVNI